MKTHKHAHSSAGLRKYPKKQEKKATIFCVTLPFVKGDRLTTLETPYELIYLPSEEAEIPQH